MKPNEIIDGLSKEDQKIINEILTHEKNYLHHNELKANSRTEREIVAKVVDIIDVAVNNDN